MSTAREKIHFWRKRLSVFFFFKYNLVQVNLIILFNLIFHMHLQHVVVLYLQLHWKAHGKNIMQTIALLQIFVLWIHKAGKQKLLCSEQIIQIKDGGKS